MILSDYICLDKTEKPLDRPVTDGGFCGILQKVAVIGDSLSSGEFESRDEQGNPGYHDMFEYSWGQFLARMAGITVYNFTRGGMTASEYCESFAEQNGFWDPDKKCKAYIIALGVNDIINSHQEMGSLDDICVEDYTKCKPTFMGYYGQIILRMKKIAPHAKFFLVTVPRRSDPAPTSGPEYEIARAINELAGFFDRTYVIDLFRYAVAYDDDFLPRFFMSGHMDAVGYQLTAKMIASYIDYIIRHNLDDFKTIGFVNTDITNPGYQP